MLTSWQSISCGALPRRIAVSLLMAVMLFGSSPLADAKKKSLAEPLVANIAPSERWAEPVNGLNTLSDFPDKEWWAQFNDPKLTRYIQTALAYNHDLAIAAEHIRIAEADARQALAQEFPHLSLSPSFSRQKVSKNMFATTSNNAPGAFSVIAPGKTINIYSVPLTASYSADIFGKNRLRTKIKNKVTVAELQRQRATVNAILLQVSGAYFNLAKADSSLAILTRQVELEKELASVQQSQYDNGLVSLDVLNDTRSRLMQAQTDVTQQKKMQAIFAHQLSVLTGSPPGTEQSIERIDFQNIELPDAIRMGDPKILLGRRPDILAEEAMLERAGLEVSLARRAYLPDLNLTGQFGFGSVTLSKLTNWDSYMASVAASLVQQVFTAGERRAVLKMQKSRYQEQVHRYQQTILNSMKDVEDHLSSLNADFEALTTARSRVALAQDNHSLTKNRFDHGISPYTDYLQTDERVLQEQAQLVEHKAQAIEDVLNLYAALGGGF